MAQNVYDSVLKLNQWSTVPASPSANFAAQNIQTTNLSVAPGLNFAYNTEYGGWRLLEAGAYFDINFSLTRNINGVRS